MEVLKNILLGKYNQFYETIEIKRLFTINRIIDKLNFLQPFVDMLNLHDNNISHNINRVS